MRWVIGTGSMQRISQESPIWSLEAAARPFSSTDAFGISIPHAPKGAFRVPDVNIGFQS